MKSIILNIVALVLIAGSAIAGANDKAAPKLKPGEEYRLSIQGIPEPEKEYFNGIYRVDAKGGITIPLAGRIKVDGMTAEQAERAMEATLRNRGVYNHPDIRLEPAKEIERPQKPKHEDG
jgi:protein involved in polysaccharide export with SLBB domain